jgi:hypothetical protein
VTTQLHSVIIIITIIHAPVPQACGLVSVFRAHLLRISTIEKTIYQFDLWLEEVADMFICLHRNGANIQIRTFDYNYRAHYQVIFYLTLINTVTLAGITFPGTRHSQSSSKALYSSRKWSRNRTSITTPNKSSSLNNILSFQLQNRFPYVQFEF